MKLTDLQEDHTRDEWLALTRFLQPISPEARDAVRFTETAKVLMGEKARHRKAMDQEVREQTSEERQ